MRAAIPDSLDLQSLFERSGDGVCVVDYDQRIVYWNRTAERLLGFKAADAVGRKCYEVIAGPDFMGHPVCYPDCSVIECARRGRALENYDVRTRTAAGKTRWINISIVVLRGRPRSSTLAVHLFRDVTDQREMQLRVQRKLSDVASSRPDAGDPRATARLTSREAEVLRMLTSGLTNADIGELLGISPITVRNHIEHILAKLGVHSRLEAVVFAAQHRLV